MFELADNLIKFEHQVVLVLPKLGFPQKQTVAKVIEIPFIDVPILRPITFHFLSSLYLLYSLKNNFDFVYARQMNSFFPLLISKLYRTIVFFEIPNDPYIAYQTNRRLKRILENITDKLSMILADKIIVLSEWSKKRLNQIGGIPLSKIDVLPSGTDTTLFHPIDKQLCCGKLGLDPSLFYVGFVGSFFVYQGIDSLIEASSIVLKNFINTKFLLVGDGPMMETWKNRVSHKGLHDAFIFTGQVPYTEVPSYIGAMDICVAPHHKDSNQASPVKLFDYMACGKPIVASDIEVVREITQDSGCALLFDPENTTALAEQIIRLLNNSSERLLLGNLGRTHVLSKHDRKKITADFLTYFSSISHQH